MIEEAVRFVLVVLVGSGAQFVDGTLGMGFGVFSASLLLASGFSPAAAVATVNVAKILAGLSSGLAHWRVGNVRRDWLLPLIGPGIIGGAAGAYLMASIPPERIRIWMSVVLVGMGILVLWRSLALPRIYAPPTPRDSDRRSFRARGRLGLLGLVAGFLNALSGAYGPFATSAVMLTERWKPHLAVGTVSLAEFFVAGAVAFTFLFEMGFEAFPWGLAVALALGGALSAPFAASMCRHVPSRILGLGIGLALISLNVGAVVSLIR